MKKAIVGIGVFALIIGIVLVALPSVYVLKTTSEPYQIPKSTVIVGAWMPLAPVDPTTSMAKGAYLNAGDTLNIQVNATSGKDIDFYVNSGVKGLVYPYSGSATELTYPNVTTINRDWIVPVSSQYSFVFNSSNLFSYKDATILVTKQWNDTAYRDVTQNVRFLPFQSAYVGVIVVLSGGAITVYGIITPKKRK